MKKVSFICAQARTGCRVNFIWVGVQHHSRSFLRPREATVCSETLPWMISAFRTVPCRQLTETVVSSNIDATEDLALMLGACVTLPMTVGIIAMRKIVISLTIGKTVMALIENQSRTAVSVMRPLMLVIRQVTSGKCTQKIFLLAVPIQAIVP